MMPITVAAGIGQQAHAAQGGGEIHQPEGEGGHKTDGQQIAEPVASQAETDGVRNRPLRAAIASARW